MSCPALLRTSRVISALGHDRPDAPFRDGVMVDVADSYRAAIIETAQAFGVRLLRDIAARKCKVMRTTIGGHAI